jgi:hypothetical protein
MKAPLWEILVSRRSWLLAGLTVPLSRAWELQQLQIRYDGDAIRVSAPTLHFLTGKPLERLKDGDAVAYLANVDLLDEARNTVRSTRGRFVVSYALWEDRFAVTQLAAGRETEGLTATAAEAWCLEGLAMNTSGLSQDRYYWLRFVIRTASAREIAAEGLPGFSIPRMIQWLGKKNVEQTQWGPLERRVRLMDLPRPTGRGSRG